MVIDEVVHEGVILLFWDVGEYVGKGLHCKLPDIFVIAGKQSQAVGLDEVRKFLRYLIEISLQKNTYRVKEISEDYLVEVCADRLTYSIDQSAESLVQPEFYVYFGSVF